jgi:thiol-disulfide isomerase/thioredoxin
MPKRTKRKLEERMEKRRRKRNRTIVGALLAAATVVALVTIYLHFSQTSLNGVAGGGATVAYASTGSGLALTNFQLTLVNGTSMNLSQLRGHPFILWFVTTWCSSCVESQQLLASQYYASLRAHGITIVEVENYDDFGEQGPTLAQFAHQYGGLNQPGWLIGSAPEWVTQKYNPSEYLDIFYLVNADQRIVGENQGLGAYLGSILQDFSASSQSTLQSQSGLISYVGTQVPQAVYSMLLSASKPYSAPSVNTYNVLSPYSGTPWFINGKPLIVYVGAEYCPYCAAARWPLVIALLRFGNFTGLQYMLSSATDVYANTPTFTFVNASYSSPYLVFESYEYENRGYQPLQSVPANYSQIWNEVGNGGIPFVDFANKVVMTGAPYDPALLDEYNWTQIIGYIQSNESVGVQIEASANMITSAVCSVDGGRPVSVCDSPAIRVYSSVGSSADLVGIGSQTPFLAQLAQLEMVDCRQI